MEKKTLGVVLITTTATINSFFLFFSSGFFAFFVDYACLDVTFGFLDLICRYLSVYGRISPRSVFFFQRREFLCPVEPFFSLQVCIPIEVSQMLLVFLSPPRIDG